MRYFITGGAGFIGSNFVEKLLNGGAQHIEKITVFDKLTYAANSKNLEQSLRDSRVRLVVGDICNMEILQQQMANHDIVVHFAAESHVDRSINCAAPFIETNVLGTLNVLETSMQVGVQKVIHVSTDEVYGSLDSGAAKEDFPLWPNSPYAASKAASDLIARSFYKTHGLDVRTTRCSNNYGKYQYPEKFIPLAIRSILAGEPVPIYGSGSNIREWILVSDHCQAILEVIDGGEAGEIYNIGSGVHISNIDLARKLNILLGRPENNIKFVLDRKGHDFRYSVETHKSLTYKTTDFDLGLNETINWYVRNVNWWL